MEVGRIAKAHGLSGEVVVDLVTNRDERIAPGSVLCDGHGAPLTVSRSSRFGDRWIVAFERVTTREEAERLRGSALFAEPIDEPGALWVDELVGSSVFDQDGTERGRVKAVIANPASDILELDDGGLIPLVFLVRRSAGRVEVDIPAGLLE